MSSPGRAFFFDDPPLAALVVLGHILGRDHDLAEEPLQPGHLDPPLQGAANRLFAIHLHLEDVPLLDVLFGLLFFGAASTSAWRLLSGLAGFSATASSDRFIGCRP